jgi:hypothetical protein
MEDLSNLSLDDLWSYLSEEEKELIPDIFEDRNVAEYKTTHLLAQLLIRVKRLENAGM